MPSWRDKLDRYVQLRSFWKLVLVSVVLTTTVLVTLADKSEKLQKFALETQQNLERADPIRWMKTTFEPFDRCGESRWNVLRLSRSGCWASVNAEINKRYPEEDTGVFTMMFVWTILLSLLAAQEFSRWLLPAEEDRGAIKSTAQLVLMLALAVGFYVIFAYTLLGIFWVIAKLVGIVTAALLTIQAAVWAAIGLLLHLWHIYHGGKEVKEGYQHLAKDETPTGSLDDALWRAKDWLKSKWPHR